MGECKEICTGIVKSQTQFCWYSAGEQKKKCLSIKASTTQNI